MLKPSLRAVCETRTRYFRVTTPVFDQLNFHGRAKEEGFEPSRRGFGVRPTQPTLSLSAPPAGFEPAISGVTGRRPLLTGP